MQLTESQKQDIFLSGGYLDYRVLITQPSFFSRTVYLWDFNSAYRYSVEAAQLAWRVYDYGQLTEISYPELVYARALHTGVLEDWFLSHYDKLSQNIRDDILNRIKDGKL